MFIDLDKKVKSINCVHVASQRLEPVRRVCLLRRRQLSDERMKNMFLLHSGCDRVIAFNLCSVDLSVIWPIV